MLNIDLSGKLALVTGGSGDLGRVICRTLADCGADVVVNYFSRRELAERVVGEIEAKGRRGLAIQADVCDPADVARMQHEVAERIGEPDIIVTNAVSLYQWTQILEQKPEDFEGQFRSCVMQNVAMAQAFVPAMIRKGWGRIIGLNTECILELWPTQGAYAAGKMGMTGLLGVLSKEIGKHNITVNEIAPGWMISDRDREKNAPRVDWYEDMLPLKHRGEDQEVANAVAFLASDLARFITGVLLPVRGGGPTIPPALQ